MSQPIAHARTFHDLHVKGRPVVLYNVWDAGSAKAVSAAGAKALATGSAPVAMANGYPDGQVIPFELALDNLRRIAAVSDVPISMDLEGAYATDPDEVGENFSRAIEAGAVGFNFEDQVVGGEGLYEIHTQVERIKAARQACDSSGIGAFLNARTDIFLKAMAAKTLPTREMLDEAINRAGAYANAGAHGFFVPGLMDIAMIEKLCASVALPVNIIALPGAPSNKELANAGVARISYGPVPYRNMIAWLQEQAKEALSID